ncbi:hypothetical protein FSP39_007001 [Pinctada imbricata]|uniref:Protein kinase domain-containing protein n=1 Tax=Pinctada imbricata TaxID=66713 RepID=A0AA89C4V0_PINIB|nr:hypothetical protein FSP39_007001 [Pinctada imbricata]
MSVKVLYSVSLTCTLIALSEQTYIEPSTTYTDIQFQQQITATSHCTSSTNGCSSSICANSISSTPSYTTITALSACSVSKNSLSINVPSEVASSDVVYVNQTSNDCSRQTRVTVSSGTGYALSFWIYLDNVVDISSGSTYVSVQLFDINSINITIGHSKQLIINGAYNPNSMSLQIDRWYHIVMRYEKDGRASIILDGERDKGLSYSVNANTLPDSPTSITFNPCGKCTECKNEFYNLNIDNTAGCDACLCSKRGSHDNVCDKISGQCTCTHNLSQYTSLCTNGACRQCDPKSNSDLDPAFGPSAGSTKVRVSGIFFGNQTTDVDIRIGQTYLTVTYINDTVLEFLTASNLSGNQEVKIQFVNLHFGNDTRPPAGLGPYTFRYLPNPTVTAANSAKTFKSGGCTVSIKGTALNSVAYPKLIVYNEQQTQELQRRDCRRSSDGSELFCDSPSMSSTGTYKYGLYLDGFSMYRNLSGMFANNSIKIIEDPTVNQAQGDKEFKPVFGSTFSIRGDQLDAACSKSDYRVDCGSEVTCSIVSVSSTEVICKPDISFPGPGVTVKLKLMIGDKTHPAQEIEFMTFWSTTEFIGIAIGAAAFVVIVIIIIVLCCCCRSRRANKNIDGHRASSRRDVKLDRITDNRPRAIVQPEVQPPKPCPTGHQYYNISQLYPKHNSPEKENWENFIHRLNESVRKQLEFSKTNMADIEPGRICTNKGEHIRIIDGSFKAGTSNYLAGRPAKIKTLVREYDTFESGLLPQWVSSGLQECLKFRDCVNENFLPMKGVATDEKRLYILYPSYHRIFKDYLNDKAISNTVRELMEFALYAADGLKFLHDEGIVHKDLATRNCIITESKIVQITDASFSWDLYSNEYMYDERRERYLPVRWMALESLKAGFYDKNSDIWTFGVVMWEIMFESNSLPYPEVTDNTKIKDHIDGGYRLGKSEETPDSLYNLMLRCWEDDSEKRVNIDTLIDTLQRMVDPDNFGVTGLYINEDDMETYQNTSFTNQGFVN